MKKSAEFRQRRQAARARRHADKRRECDHEYTPSGDRLTVTPILEQPRRFMSVFPPAGIAQAVIAPHVNRKHGVDNRS